MSFSASSGHHQPPKWNELQKADKLQDTPGSRGEHGAKKQLTEKTRGLFSGKGKAVDLDGVEGNDTELKIDETKTCWNAEVPPFSPPDPTILRTVGSQYTPPSKGTESIFLET